METKKVVLEGKHYLICDDGNIIKPFKTTYIYLSKHLRKGYEYIEITCKNGRKKKYSVHRLVCEAFINNPDSKPQVNHIDGNKTNNRASNLEWCESPENQMHSRYILGNQTGFKDRPVICIDTGEQFVSTRDAWRKTGINYCHICECASGKRKSAGKMRWSYAPLG